MLRCSLVLFSLSLLAVGGVPAQTQKNTPKRPAIDEAAPTKFETATLALG